MPTPYGAKCLESIYDTTAVQLHETQTDHTPLQAGEIVTTGTITTAHSVHAGETWQSEVQGIALPGLTVEFSA